jgi:Tfp pilus assembly protein PilV
MRPRSVRLTVPRPSPAGFTLVEVLVAIVLIEIGLFALMASSAVVIREARIVRARTSAIEVARNRIETIVSSPCAATSGSVSSSNGVHEEWSARLVPVLTREIRDSVTFTAQRVTRSIALRTRVPCTP